MLIPRAAPNRVRLFFVACGGDKNGAAENKSGRGQEFAVKRTERWERGKRVVRAECVEYVEYVEYVNHVNHVRACRCISRKEDHDNTIGRCKKEATHAEIPLPRPLPTPNRLPCTLRPAPATSTNRLRHKPGTALPAKSRHPNAIYPAGRLYPHPAAPLPLSPNQLFLSHAAGRSAFVSANRFYSPFRLTIHGHVGMSAGRPSECPSVLTVACQHRPVALTPAVPAHHRNVLRPCPTPPPTAPHHTKTDRDDPCGSSRC